jgi:3-hydroxybutyryl-CoA dehydrogenase
MMQIVVICNQGQKEELFSNGNFKEDDFIWIEKIESLKEHNNLSAILDLQFKKEGNRVQVLESFLPALIFINSVEYSLKETHNSFIRINGWPSFLSSSIIEASTAIEELKNRATHILQLINKTPEWLPDAPGFVTPRVISMIINEAFLALEEGVSTKEEINTAMKLGTNYPYGPFEWAEKIGQERIVRLLNKLSLSEPRYFPSTLLTQSCTAS